MNAQPLVFNFKGLTVVTLAFAMGAAYDESDDTSVKQARIRYTRLVINDLLCNAKMVFFTANGNLAVWKSDDGDGQIQGDEMVYIERGIQKDHISLINYTSQLAMDADITIVSIKSGAAMTGMNSIYNRRTVNLIADDCREVWYRLDVGTPFTRFVNISFELFENGRWKDCQINNYISAGSDNLLNGSGSSLISDDDL